MPTPTLDAELRSQLKALHDGLRVAMGDALRHGARADDVVDDLASRRAERFGA